MKKILIVDDEVQILKALSRVFFDTDYVIFTAESGQAALSLLEQHEIDLVISDMRMPLMDGYELLSKVKETYPDIIRIILSGYADESTVFKAILHNIAKFYLLKPWHNEKLLCCIDQVFETEELLKSKDLLVLINNLEKIPTIEASYHRILAMINQDDDTGYIASEIEKDFAISTKLLQIANSAFYGVQTGSVKHATIYLGLQNLKSLIYSTSILNAGDISSIDQKNVDLLWEHALLTNKILHYIYDQFLEKKIPEAASSAGLLHNIGALILIQNYYADYIGIMRKAKEESKNLLLLEKEAFHVTHQDAGGYLISWWGLPFPIVESALFHHRPLDSCIINKEIVGCVHIAQQYAWIKINEPPINQFFPEVFDLLGISQEGFESAMENGNWI